jgi:hypothetical protein
MCHLLRIGFKGGKVEVGNQIGSHCGALNYHLALAIKMNVRRCQKPFSKLTKFRDTV